MNLFVFGLGYSALNFVRGHASAFKAVSGTVRTAEKQMRLGSEGIDALVCNAEYDDPALAARLASADVLVVSVPPDASGDSVFDRFGAQIAASRVARIVYLSTVGVYSDHDGGWIDESAATVADSGRRGFRVAAEAKWRALPGERTTILRLAGIYGPNRNALVNLAAGKARRIIKKGQVFNRIHVDDIGRALAAACISDRVGIWNVSDDEPAPPQDVIAFAATLMGIDVPAAQDFADADMTDMARSFYATSNRISNARLKQDLGIELAFPTYREGLAALWQASCRQQS